MGLPSPESLPPHAVVIHGGMHKTGSSALQNLLATRRELLAAAGWLYPVAGLVRQEATGHRHRVLMTELRKEEGTPTWAALRQEIDAWPGRVILSHENFFSPQIDPQAVVAELPGRDVFLVVYVRHPVDYVESCYREWVRRWKYTGSLADHYARRKPYLALDRLASQWHAAIGAGRLLLRPYDRQSFNGGSVTTDFLSLLGLAALPGLADAGAARANDSLDSAQALVHLVANQIVAPPDKRNTLSSLVHNAQAAVEVLELLPPPSPEDGEEALAGAQALRTVLGRSIGASRIMDDRLVAEIETRHLAAFEAALGQHALPSAYRLLPHDAGFSDPALRASIRHLLR